MPSPPSRRRSLLALSFALVALAPTSLGCATLDAKQREWIFRPSSWRGAAAAAAVDDEAGALAELFGLPDKRTAQPALRAAATSPTSSASP